MTDTLRIFQLAVLVVLLACCGNRALSPGSDQDDGGGAGTTTNNNPTGDDTPVSADSGPLPDSRNSAPVECAIGIRVDACCTSPEPVTTAQIAQDPCLVRFELSFDFDIPQQCRDRWPESCRLVMCERPEPPSRVVAPNGSGGCSFVSECETDDDCTRAVDHRQCCACDAVYPTALVDEDDCLVTEIDEQPAPASCSSHCPDVNCAPCEDPGEAACFEAQPALNRCVSIQSNHS